ncbi:pantoate--beta-alanine ligase [bacterium]|nr:pantoate--beta-alanine ligase [bacterium]
MEQINKIARMQERAIQIHKKGLTIGLVPTMGYLHDGHLSLMREARRETDCVVVSIFVNPIQFGPSEDFAKYPRDIERDIGLAEQSGVDIIFNPAAKDMYPLRFRTIVDVPGLNNILCSANRPGHFQGVATVVCKLFNIVRPDFAYFGQKDAQQAVIIKRMAEDLNMGIRIRVLPIVREKDGLAMSSRNIYLSQQERRAALCLYNALKLAEKLALAGEKETRFITNQVEALIKSEPLAKLEYAAICNPVDLSYMETIEGEALLALAVKIGSTRLIDNTILKTI